MNGEKDSISCFLTTTGANFPQHHPSDVSLALGRGKCCNGGEGLGNRPDAWARGVSFRTRGERVDLPLLYWQRGG